MLTESLVTLQMYFLPLTPGGKLLFYIKGSKILKFEGS